MTHVSPVTARRWQSGKRPVPAQVAAAIEAMTDAVVRLSSKTADKADSRASSVVTDGADNVQSS
jgi:hypothetical protein